jgi:MarR family transcriptional regulator, transcriptional regulator for hemolysin
VPAKKPAYLRPTPIEDRDSEGPRGAGAPDLVNPMDKFIGYKIRRLKHAIISELNDILREFELRIMDFAILCIVDANAGLHQNVIARMLGAEPPAVVLALDRLETAGYLIRRHGEDRRLRTLHLTASGKQLQRKALAKVEEQERRIAHAARKDLPRLLSALDNLMRNYDLLH